MSREEVPAVDHGRLGFVDLALKAFAFLLDIGFEVVRCEETSLRFESSTVFVNVYHGRCSYHIGLELGRVQEGDLYSLYEILTAVAPYEIEKARWQTTNSKVLERCLSAIAEIINQECRPLLSGAPSAFDSLRSIVGPLRRAATLQAKFGATMDRADRAWEDKDMRLAEDLYKEAEAALDEKRTRRLNYLRSKREAPGK